MVNSLVMIGEGINCDVETAGALERTIHTFERSGSKVKSVHVNDLITGEEKLDDYQIIAFPGGFSYGDYLGSGIVFANKLKSSHLYDNLSKSIDDGSLVLGICNGFQILVKLGILPALDDQYGEQQATLHLNDNGRFENRWVHLKVNPTNCAFTQDIDSLYLVVRHGEGKFMANPDVMEKLQESNQIAMQYVDENGELIADFPINPNGSQANIAAVTDPSGHVLGMMPHPEAFQDFFHDPQWTRKKYLHLKDGKTIYTLPKEGAGLKIFQNAIEYFK